MSVLVPPLPSSTNNHHHYFSSSTTTRRLNGGYPTPTAAANKLLPTASRLASTMKAPIENKEPDGDHVPFGVVNSMKQRLLDKVNESLLLNSNPITRHSLSKPLSRLSSHENLLTTKPPLATHTVTTIHQTPGSPLKRTTRLSRSQDNLCNSNTKEIGTTYLGGHAVTAEQLTSFLQPKQDVIIVDTTVDNDHDNSLRIVQKTSAHRHSYTELHVDEAPKPGTVNTVKNMFERQIRLSRYDADKLFNSITPVGSRVSSQHREISSPPRSRSMSPNDLALRQRRTSIPGSLPPAPTTLLLPVPASYPDLVTSHTPPTSSHIETNKPNSEQPLTNTSSTFAEVVLPNTSNSQGKLYGGYRASVPAPLEHIPPVTTPVEEIPLTTGSHHHRPHLLLASSSLSPSTPINGTSLPSSDTVDCKPLDFKSRLALFSRNSTTASPSTPRSNDIPQVVPTATPPIPVSAVVKKPTNHHSTPPPPPNFLTKPIVHHHLRPSNDDKKEIDIETMNHHHHQIPAPIARTVVNTAKAVTFFGGAKVNGNSKMTSSLPASVPPPPAIKNEQSSMTITNDQLRVPDIIGGNVKLNKSSIASGAKKDVRVQFMDDVDTFEYPSFEVTMAEFNNANNSDNDDEEPSSSSSDSGSMHKNVINGHMNDKQHSSNENNNVEDVDDDELDRLARINAEFNSNNLGEKPLKPKGTLHTFRPTHLDQYELGTQHGSLNHSTPSDISTSNNSYSLLARQKLLSPLDSISNNFSSSNGSNNRKQSTFDMASTVQWSSMSTTTDLLF